MDLAQSLWWVDRRIIEGGGVW